MTRIRTFFCLLFAVCSLSVMAEILQPVVWHTEEKNDSVYFLAQIEKGWHLTIISINGETDGDEYSDEFVLAVAKNDMPQGMNIRFNACDDSQCTSPETFSYNTRENIDSQGVVQNTDSGNDLWHIFLLGLLAGLLAVFTPCVWPVIPMTVSFFVKKGGGAKDALLYGLSIIVLYVGLGVIVTALFGASALNSLSTNAWLNLFFFIVFVVFALSFFGLFEIRLPSSWSTYLDSHARSSSGLLSIVFMAFTLAVVSFSCTGPLIGTLLVEAADKSLYAPVVGMSGFAISLALPFTLFALFPSLLRSLPRSGNWMDAFKVTLAFIELALSLKFLSVADMAYGWGILPRWLFLILWSLCFASLAVYLIWHTFRITESYKTIRRAIVILLSVLSLSFSAYLISGLAGGKMKLVAAFLPPEKTEANVYTDLQPALEAAISNGKPLLLQFSGYGCVNCRKMEVAVLGDEEVKAVLNEYIEVLLFVDSRQDENGNGLEDGEEWTRLQRELLRQNSQPCFAVLTNEQILMLYKTITDKLPITRLTDSNGNYVPTYGYTENKYDFINWLKTQ